MPNIQDGSVTGTDVSDDSTLRGLDIDESDLRQVPSALNAEHCRQRDDDEPADPQASRLDR